VEDLDASELKVSGGTWNGLLFENATIGYPLSLSWTFTIEFASLHRDYGEVDPSLTVDWVPAGESRWNAMTGHRYTCNTFAGPIEPSFYYFDHFRFERGDVVVEEQVGGELRVDAAIGGDLDGLGLAEISARRPFGLAASSCRRIVPGVTLVRRPRSWQRSRASTASEHDHAATTSCSRPIPRGHSPRRWCFA